MESAAAVRDVEVQVVTTSGVYPAHGTEKEPINHPVSKVLEKAQKKLDIADTTNWIATVGGVEINPTNSYVENHLTGHLKIDWGPREGGGGKGVRPRA
jgi:hypothetical protein